MTTEQILENIDLKLVETTVEGAYVRVYFHSKRKLQHVCNTVWIQTMALGSDLLFFQQLNAYLITFFPGKRGKMWQNKLKEHSMTKPVPGIEWKRRIRSEEKASVSCILGAGIEDNPNTVILLTSEGQLLIRIGVTPLTLGGVAMGRQRASRLGPHSLLCVVQERVSPLRN